MAYESLRPWLQVLEQQGMFKWVDKEVDKDWEVGAVLRMIFPSFASYSSLIALFASTNKTTETTGRNKPMPFSKF